jgi:hypothetical protein
MRHVSLIATASSCVEAEFTAVNASHSTPPGGGAICHKSHIRPQACFPSEVITIAQQMRRRKRKASHSNGVRLGYGHRK